MGLFYSYLITEPHDTARWADSNESTGHETLHTGLFGSLGEGNLVLLFGGTDTADDHINSSQRLDKLFLGGLQVAFPNLASPILKARDSRLLGRYWTNQGNNFLSRQRRGINIKDTFLSSWGHLQSHRYPRGRWQWSLRFHPQHRPTKLWSSTC